MIRRKANRRHMTGDHHGRTSEKATLQVRAADEILGTHTCRARSATTALTTTAAATSSSRMPTVIPVGP